jgi:transposase-like protein
LPFGFASFLRQETRLQDWTHRYSLNYRDLEEMVAERGVAVDHSIINRWFLKFARELDKRTRGFLNSTNNSWRVDETDIEVKGEWKDLYRAVDAEGDPLDFMLSASGMGRLLPVFSVKSWERSTLKLHG